MVRRQSRQHSWRELQHLCPNPNVLVAISSKTWHQQNPPVLKRRCRLTQVNLYSGSKKMVGWHFMKILTIPELPEQAYPHSRSYVRCSRPCCWGVWWRRPGPSCPSVSHTFCSRCCGTTDELSRALCMLHTHTRWRHGVVVSGICRMNEDKKRRARLVSGWVTVFGQVYHLGM